MGTGISSPWFATFQLIRDNHDKAYLMIEEAISLEEQEKPQEAIEKYKEGISIIDNTLNINVSSPQHQEPTWVKACEMIQKMKRTRAEVLMRINSIQSAPGFTPQEPPPSYDEAVNTNPLSITYTDLAVALNNLRIEPPQGPGELLYSHDNVRLYFISPEGVTTQTSKFETLRIISFKEEEDKPALVILEIGDWIYPLIPGVSPCFRTDYGAFILPDIYASATGSSVGIILPSDADESVYDLLESILYGIISQETEFQIVRREPATVSESISNGLVKGAYYISWGLTKGAVKIGELMNYNTPKLINSIAPAPNPTHVSSNVSKGFQIAEGATSTAANVTGYVADKVAFATQALGRYLAPHIQRQGTKLLTSTLNLTEEDASSRMEGVLVVAAGAVEGFSTVYRGLETSASILGQNISSNTVKIVEHKYGSNAAGIAASTFNTVGNVINVGQNTKFLTPRGVVKVTAKETGKAVVQEYRTSLRQQNASTFNSVYPNLNGLRDMEAGTSGPIEEKPKASTSEKSDRKEKE